LLAFAVGAIIAWIYSTSYKQCMIWSVSFYEGNTPFNLHPIKDRSNKQIILQGSDVSGCDIRFVADPFMVYANEQWNLFFEALDNATEKGVIGLATSKTGYDNWEYQSIVLDEPFHLSYPIVFESDDKYYMIPETCKIGAVRLYEAESFPLKWQYKKDLLQGEYADSTIFFHDGTWYLFTLFEDNALTLYFSDDVLGEWVEHPKSPILSDDLHTARPGGRVVRYDDKILRFAQDGLPSYGQSVRVFQIHELTKENYRESELVESPVLESSGSGWNALGMHHIDLHEMDDGHCIACVDGRSSNKKLFSWRHGWAEFVSKFGR
jgi:hypothetical protein